MNLILLILHLHLFVQKQSLNATVYEGIVHVHAIKAYGEVEMSLLLVQINYCINNIQVLEGNFLNVFCIPVV